MAGYQHTGRLDCSIDIDTSSLQGKTAIVTGGAKGIGKAYARALVAAGCTVIIADMDEAAGKAFGAEMPNQLHFVKCNVTVWEEQVQLFNQAVQLSPTRKIHHVVANAGIFRPDSVFSYSEPPTEPGLSTIDLNVKGTLYTTKLAMHHFIRQNGTRPSQFQEDTSLVLISSGAGIHDCLRSPQYCASKWAVRGIMHSLRRTAHLYGSRVNVICPYYVETSILRREVISSLKGKGVGFATLEDAGRCLLRLVSDAEVNGRSLFVAPRKWAASGYMDLDLEDTEENELRREIQVEQMCNEPVEAGLFV